MIEFCSWAGSTVGSGANRRLSKRLALGCTDAAAVRHLLDAEGTRMTGTSSSRRSAHCVATTGRSRLPGTTTSCCGTIQ